MLREGGCGWQKKGSGTPSSPPRTIPVWIAWLRDPVAPTFHLLPGGGGNSGSERGSP